MHYCFIQRSYFLSSFYFTFQLHQFFNILLSSHLPKDLISQQVFSQFHTKVRFGIAFYAFMFCVFQVFSQFHSKVWFGFTFCALMFCVFPFFYFLAVLFDFSVILVSPMHCLQNPQTSLFNNIFIKNKLYGTIYRFKNYFVTVFSVFNFQQNKLYLNGS